MSLLSTLRLPALTSPAARLPLLLLGAALALGWQPAAARAAKGEIPGSPDQMQATIPGTHMTRDEFRARAFSQLQAVALNAHAYYAVNGDFPATYYDLFNSDAWNLDITDMFSGRPVDSLQFAPKPGDYTTSAPVLMPMPGSADDDDASSTGEPPLKMTGNAQDGYQIDTKELSERISNRSQAGARRVKPEAIQPKNPGSIFYYVKGKMLQLVIFAPDGTYMEYVSETPNNNWLNLLNIKAEGRSFPSDLFANEVLLYLERVLPRDYNLVKFMSGAEPVAEPDLQTRGAETRLQMAKELDVTVFNPYTKHAALVATAVPKPGEMVTSKPAQPVAIALRSGEVVSFAQLSAGLAPIQGSPRPGAPKPAPAKPKQPSSPPPLGGHRM